MNLFYVHTDHTHGRVTAKSLTVGGIALTKGYVYNAAGQLTTMTLP